MIQPKLIFFASLLMMCAYDVSAMKCQLPMGLELSCPTMFNDEDKAFCCNSQDNIPYCCDIGDYVKNNSAILAGILVGAVILLIIITLCCCCFCSCCLLAKRRVQRGTVLYAPVAPAPVVSPAAATTIPPPVYATSPYPLQPGLMVHAPPPNSAYPPPYSQGGEFQPPLNPNFKG